MQLKYLNVYKLLANISVNLVGAFVPVIVFEATGKLWLGVLSYIAQYLVRMLTVFLLKKQMQTKPQILLVLRVVPILLYSISVILIDTHMWLGVFGAVFFVGLSNGLMNLSSETIFNYSSLSEENGSQLGLTRLLEQLGVFVSFIVGGYLLQMSKIITVIISIVIYIIAVIPLVIYYVNCRKEKTFNKDAISNASITFEKDEKRYNYGKVLSKRLLLIYGITYFTYCLLDAFATMYNLHVFSVNGSYAIVGTMRAIYNGMYGVGNFVYGKIAEKRDIMIDVCVSCLLAGACVGAIIFINVNWVLYILYAVLGFVYAPICLFNLQRLLSKSRILGVSNKALYVREQVSNGSVVVASLFGMFGTIIPSFVAIIISLMVSAWLIPYHEEKSRRLLVDYLQYNEIRSRTIARTSRKKPKKQEN